MFRLGSRNGVEELLLGDLLLQVWNFLPRDVETDVIGPPCVCKAVEAEPARDVDDGTRSPEFSFEQLGLNENGEPFEYSRGRRIPHGNTVAVTYMRRRNRVRSNYFSSERDYDRQMERNAGNLELWPPDDFISRNVCMLGDTCVCGVGHEGADGCVCGVGQYWGAVSIIEV